VSRAFVPLTRVGIARARALALRRGVWYRVLTRVERACVDLSARVVERVRSRVLARVLTGILSKLHSALESTVERMAREVGRPLARRLSVIAQGWGNGCAAAWAEDQGFVRYLAIGMINAGWSP